MFFPETMTLPELHWIGLSVLIVLLASLLIWGLRRDRRAEVMAMKEIASDDPAPDPVSQTALCDYAASTMMEDRRFLGQAWREDTPDLIVSFWCAPRDASARHSSFRQLFLPLLGGWEGLLRSLEGEIFEAAEEQSIPVGSLLDASWCFLRLPGMGGDAVIRTRFAGGRFVHRVFLSDSDGKLHGVRREELPLTGGGSGWAVYREAVARWLLGDSTEAAMGQLDSLCSQDATRGHAHSWMALLGWHDGADGAEVRRHLSFAREFSPDNLHARLVKARLTGPEALCAEIVRLNRLITVNTDRRVQTGFLFAQSLHSLGHDTVARGLCEIMLAEAPRHSATSRLIRRIDQRQRGAQT